jgi:hypothetical protein
VGVGGIWVAVLVGLGVISRVSITSVSVGGGSLLQAAKKIIETEITSKRTEQLSEPHFNEVI